MCGNENGVGDNGVTRFGNTPESNYGFHWNPSKDVEYDVVRERQLFWLSPRLRLRHRIADSTIVNSFGFGFFFQVCVFVQRRQRESVKLSTFIRVVIGLIFSLMTLKKSMNFFFFFFFNVEFKGGFSFFLILEFNMIYCVYYFNLKSKFFLFCKNF